MIAARTANPVTVARMRREYNAAIRAEEGAATLTIAYRLAAASEKALRRLQCAAAGIPMPVTSRAKGLARKGLSALAAIGRAVAVAMQEVRRSLRRSVATVAGSAAILVLALSLVACVDAGTEPAPDAGPVTAEAPSCCDLLPDQDAVRSCVALPAGTCGVIACPNPGGGFTKINACGGAQ